MPWITLIGQNSNTISHSFTLPFMNYRNYQQEPQRHLNSYIHSIIEYIKKSEAPVLFTDIKERLNINLYNNPMILSSLKKNVKIKIERESIQFVPKYHIKTLEDLRDLIRKTNCEYGIEVNELLDCFCDIKQFIEHLKENNEIFTLKDADNSMIIYYNDYEISKADEEIVNIWNSLRVPDYVDVKKELAQAGLKTGSEEPKRKIACDKRKKTKRFTRKIKLTNTHIKDFNFE